LKKLLVILLTAIVLAGCSKKADSITAPQVSKSSSKTKYDYDFTTMNFNVASGIMFDILVTPEKYAGKTVKIAGKFNSQEYEGKRYFTAVIWDSTGCCPIGLDFIPPEGMKYPFDFPKDDEDITVCGKWEPQLVDGEEQLWFIAESIQ